MSAGTSDPKWPRSNVLSLSINPLSSCFCFAEQHHHPLRERAVETQKGVHASSLPGPLTHLPGFRSSLSYVPFLDLPSLGKSLLLYAFYIYQHCSTYHIVWKKQPRWKTTYLPLSCILMAPWLLMSFFLLGRWRTHSIKKFLGQGSNLCHSSNPSHSSDNTRSESPNPQGNPTAFLINTILWLFASLSNVHLAH